MEPLPVSLHERLFVQKMIFWSVTVLLKRVMIKKNDTNLHSLSVRIQQMDELQENLLFNSNSEQVSHHLSMML